MHESVQVCICDRSLCLWYAQVLAAALVPMKEVEGGWKIAAALCSRHIGGAINYVAVCDVLQPPPALVTVRKSSLSLQ